MSALSSCCGARIFKQPRDSICAHKQPQTDAGALEFNQNGLVKSAGPSVKKPRPSPFNFSCIQKMRIPELIRHYLQEDYTSLVDLGASALSICQSLPVFFGTLESWKLETLEKAWCLVQRH